MRHRRKALSQLVWAEPETRGRRSRWRRERLCPCHCFWGRSPGESKNSKFKPSLGESWEEWDSGGSCGQRLPGLG